MDSFSPYSSTVLTVRQFPLLFNDADRREFLEHFGATRVSCMKRYQNQTNLIVADFGVPPVASQALVRLHQLEVLRRRLVVEYCPLDLAQFAFSQSADILQRDRHDDQLHGISPGHNQIRYSLPSERLAYLYPPLDENILTNINNALWAVPSFYTQVLHLMNKMSLPCPMMENTTRASRSSSIMNVACQTDESVLCEVMDMDTDDDESEIDDGEEERRMKRRHREHRLVLAKPKGREVIPTIEIDMTIDRDFRKKPIIEFRLPQTLHSSQFEEITTTTMKTTSQGFGRMEPIQTASSIQPQPAQGIEPLPPLPLIPLEEIAKNRLSEEQLRLYDNGRLYRNYERGSPSQRLYIKNLDIKHVDERLLHAIFDRYSDNPSSIDIHLLREGKMKGQAFVTLPNDDAAQCALNDTNGYVLYEKPMIVQFARSAKSKDNV